MKKKKQFKPKVNIVKECDKIMLKIKLIKGTWVNFKE